MKSSGKTLPSKKKQERILQFFLTNIKSVELGNLLARELKRKRKGLPIRSGLKTAPVDLSHFYVYSNSFESMVNHLAHVPPFSSIFPDARIMAPLLTTGCAQAADNSAQNAYPLLNQWISFALVHMYHSHFGFPLEIFQHLSRLFYKVDLAPASLQSPDSESQHNTDERPEFVQLAGEWLTETKHDSVLEECESMYIESLATSVPLFWSVLLRPIDEFSSSSAENEALELIRSGAYDEAADSFRALSEAAQFELRHRFNLAYCLSLTGDIEEAHTTTRESLRAQFQSLSYMPSLKKRTEGAICVRGYLLPDSLPGLATEQVHDGGRLAGPFGTVRWDQSQVLPRPQTSCTAGIQICGSEFRPGDPPSDSGSTLSTPGNLRSVEPT